MYDRESRQVRAKVIPNTKRETLQNEILKNVKYGSKVYTDEAGATTAQVALHSRHRESRRMLRQGPSSYQQFGEFLVTDEAEPERYIRCC